MAWTIPTREQIFSALIGDAKSAMPTKNVSRGSDLYRIGRVVSGAIWAVVAKTIFYVKQSLPDTATDSFLDRIGKKVYSFLRLNPVGSTGTDCLQVFGDEGESVAVDDELAHADGTLYKLTTGGTISGGSVVVSVAAISTGLATNKDVDEVLTFTSPPPGIAADATLIAPLTGGLDLESDDAYRVRLLAHIGDPPEGGAVHDYVEWAKSIAGVKDAGVYAHRRGAGTIDVWVLGPGTGPARVPSAAVLTAVDDYIESVRPGNVRDWLLLTTTPETLDVELTIEQDETAFGWDWDDEGTGYLITANSEGSSTITVPTAPATVVIGTRLTVRGEEAQVTNRVGDVLTLSFEEDHDGNAIDWFTFTVVNSTDEIRASGDKVREVRFAIMDAFNRLGPARSSFSKTGWIDELKISKLYAAATDVAGVDDASFTTPTVNTGPTADAFEEEVFFLVPGEIRVYKP